MVYSLGTANYGFIFFREMAKGELKKENYSICIYLKSLPSDKNSNLISVKFNYLKTSDLHIGILGF